MSHIHGRSSDGTMQEIGADSGGGLTTAPVARYSNKTGNGVVSGVPAILYGYTVTVAMSAAATTVYDNATEASGTAVLVIPASKAVGEYVLPVGIKCVNGIYASFAGTGTVNFLYRVA